MAILTGAEIKKQIEHGNIDISPYNPARIEPNSFDLTLGKGVKVYKEAVATHPRIKLSNHAKSFRRSQMLLPVASEDEYDPYLDARKPNETVDYEIDESGWMLKPDILYLMHTQEQTFTKNYVTELTGKSSVGRLGIIVHFTAAHAETGFEGQWTLEVSAMHPVKIYAGMPIAQMLFHTIEGEVWDYRTKGNYTKELARGAVASRSWMQK
jgi:dCTP deaminase